MSQFPHSPFLWLRVDKTGEPQDPDIWSKIEALVDQTQADDLVLISHGWKNNEDAARELYTELWSNTGGLLSDRGARTVVVGVQWPSARYPKRLEAELIDGGGAQGLGGGADGDVPEDEYETELGVLLDFLAPEDRGAIEAAARGWAEGRDEAAADRIFEANVAGQSEADEEVGADLAPLPTTPAGRYDAIAALETADGQASGVQDLGDALGRWFSGPRAAVIKVLEQFSFYEMKDRAGIVGRKISQSLGVLRSQRPVRLHLVGHSFGARLVTAAASTFAPSGAMTLSSLTLLQGAFSHNGFSADRKGAFTAVISKVSGPISITHTHNDKACFGIYAYATRLSGDTTQAVGGPGDKFGAIGANGAQGVSVNTLTAHDVFEPAPGEINNFLATRYISDHGDVRNAKVGALLAATIEASPS